MEVKASWRFVARPVKAAGPALAAFLVTSAGVAAIAQPIGLRPEPVPAPLPLTLAPLTLTPPAPAPLLPASVRPATIRIILPPPTPLAPPKRDKPAETLGFAASRLDAISAGLGNSTPGTAAPATSVAENAPLRMAPVQPIDAPPPHPSAPQNKSQAAGFVATTGLSDADYSAAIRTISARPEPRAIPMVDAESRAALARMNGDDDVAPSGTERLDALQPARSLTEAAAPREARPVGMSPIRMQDDDGISRYHRTAQGLAFDVAATVNGASVGKVSLLIRDGENISIRLADLLAAIQPAIDPALYQKLSASQAAQSYMTFNALREAGIAVRFNDNDRLILGIK